MYIFFFQLTEVKIFKDLIKIAYYSPFPKLDLQPGRWMLVGYIPLKYLHTRLVFHKYEK